MYHWTWKNSNNLKRIFLWIKWVKSKLFDSKVDGPRDYLSCAHTWNWTPPFGPPSFDLARFDLFHFSDIELLYSSEISNKQFLLFCNFGILLILSCYSNIIDELVNTRSNFWKKNLKREKFKNKMSYHYSRHNLMSDSNIFIAAKLGDSELLKDLLAAGHKINHRDKYGKSALHHAVEGKPF